jgi:hypothetical protein
MTQPKPIADLIGALKDLLTLPTVQMTGDAERMNRAVKHRARQLIEQYESVNMFTQVQTKMGIENEK